MAGHTAPAVLGPIGSLTLLPLYFELDGSFPNHEANPLEPANLVDLQRYVLETGADIGLAFDGDADRCFVVDERGNPVSPSAVTALVAGRELTREIGATVIHNLITSRAVPELVIERGGTPVRSRVGHSYIKALMADTGAIFGGEHSAHYYFRDNFYADNGFIPALLILELVSERGVTLSELLEPYRSTYFISGEINTKLSSMAAVPAKLDVLRARYADGHQYSLDGLSVEYPDWHFNVRASNTEPLLRLNLEAKTPGMMEARRDEVLGLIRA